MRIPCKVQISDLQPTESFVEEELTLEEAEKIVGGSGDDHNFAYFAYFSRHCTYEVANSMATDDDPKKPRPPKINSN